MMDDQKPPRKPSWFKTSKRREPNIESDADQHSWRKYFFLKRRRSKREDALFFDIEDSRFPSAPCVCTHFQLAPPEPRSASPTRHQQRQMEEHVYEEVPDEDDVYDVGQVQPHTQVDYVNYLIPKMSEIISCPYYWGKIDRYEAEALLEGKPEGSFLLRDSAQDDFVFSVSFRRYNRSLHARIEESGHKFSFDCHDPGVHSSPSVCGLLEFYKDPVSCMFFEPMLLYPVIRTSCFSLQALARSAIADNCTYSAITHLPLPKPLKCFIREYHYRHKVRTRHLE